MSWETLAYTDAGIELMMDAVSGKQLTITQAVGGGGLANAAVLHAQTDVTGERHALELLGIEPVEENGSAARRVKIRITGAEDTYTLHQIALFGRQSGAAEDTLLLLVQDDRGVEIPAASADQEFEFVFAVVIAISRDAEIAINLSAEMRSLQLFVEERIQEHDLSPESHKDLRIAAAKLRAEIDLLKLKYDTSISKNPFTVTFGSLDGAIVTGVWNDTLARVEF
ncbi:MAG: hypothetical protein SOY50_07895 [Ruminococcus callidus]|nr:hypothetical protein [Ruminococcus callidus]